MNEVKKPQDAAIAKKAVIAVMVAATAYYFVRNRDTAILANVAGALDGMAYYTWPGMIFSLVSCITAPLWGKIGDIIGRKKVLIALLVLMAAGDLIASAAPNIFVFIIGYGIAGIGSGGMMATYFALLGDLFAPDKRGLYGGYLLAIMNIVNIFLPFLAASLTQNASWRYVYVLTSAVYLISLGSARFLLPAQQFLFYLLFPGPAHYILGARLQT
jgi:MFS family permease